MSELHLINEVRDRIRAHADYRDEHVNVEYDERAPAIAPDLYIMVIPAGIEAGENYGTVIDEVYSVDIIIALRATHIARDRKRRVLTELRQSFYQHRKNIRDQIDFDYTTLTNANTTMIADGEATAGCDIFMEPLQFMSAGRIREAPAEIFAGTSGETIAALVRTIHYGGARRMIARS